LEFFGTNAVVVDPWKSSVAAYNTAIEVVDGGVFIVCFLTFREKYRSLSGNFAFDCWYPIGKDEYAAVVVIVALLSSSWKNRL
jgi:hypothetical protein